MTDADPAIDDSGWSDWLVSVGLGATMGFAVLSVGLFGMALAALALGLIAWKGSVLVGFAGFACGFSGLWAFIWWGVVARCDAENLQPGTHCEAPFAGAYAVGAIVVLALGVAATSILVRRRRRRPR